MCSANSRKNRYRSHNPGMSVFFVGFDRNGMNHAVRFSACPDVIKTFSCQSFFSACANDWREGENTSFAVRVSGLSFSIIGDE